MSEYIVKCKEFVGISGAMMQFPECIDMNKEIVRCRDCVYYKPDPYPIDPGWPMYCEDSGRDMLEPDGFCAWGIKRKEGE